MDNEKKRVRKYPGPAGSASSREAEGRWEILLAGDFNDRHIELLEALLEVPRNSQGILYIDSNGGSVYTSLAITSMIQLRGLRAKGVVLGECSSAALLPFAACQDRYVTPTATHLFHAMKWESEENVRLEEAAEWARHFQQVEEQFDALLARLFKVDIELIRKWTLPGRFVTGQELVNAGLAKMLDPFAGDIYKQVF